MSQQALDGLEVVVGQQQMTGKGVPEGVRRNPFGDSGARGGLFDSTLNMGFVSWCWAGRGAGRLGRAASVAAVASLAGVPRAGFGRLG